MLCFLFAIIGAVRHAFLDERGEPTADALERFYAGDQVVMAQLYQRHAPRAVAQLRKYLPRIDTEAVVQEAFVTLMAHTEQRRRFKGGSFAAFLCIMTRYRGIDAWRREQRYVEAESLPEATDANSDVDDRLAAREILHKFLERSVPPKQKAFFQARFIDQRTQIEAAELLQIRRSTLATWEKGLAERLRKAVVSGEVTYVAQGAACTD
jgi:RNA polymerase sigma factor (sigma-70 family)